MDVLAAVRLHRQGWFLEFVGDAYLMRSTPAPGNFFAGDLFGQAKRAFIQTPDNWDKLMQRIVKIEVFDLSANLHLSVENIGVNPDRVIYRFANQAKLQLRLTNNLREITGMNIIGDQGDFHIPECCSC